MNKIIKLNMIQKRLILVTLLIISSFIIIWLFSGAEIFTKSAVLIEKKDTITGISYKEWQEKYVPGLDYTASVIFVFTAVSGLFFFNIRDNKPQRLEED